MLELKKLFQIKKSAAFSYIEAVVSLLIISLICFLIANVYSVSIKSINKTRNKLTATILHMNADSELRDLINGINYPYWVKEYNIESDENTITVEYFKGNPEKYTGTFNNIKIVECDFLRTNNKEPIGIFIKYTINDKEYETKELFSSFPFGAVKI